MGGGGGNDESFRQPHKRGEYVAQPFVVAASGVVKKNYLFYVVIHIVSWRAHTHTRNARQPIRPKEKKTTTTTTTTIITTQRQKANKTTTEGRKGLVIISQLLVMNAFHDQRTDHPLTSPLLPRLNGERQLVDFFPPFQAVAFPSGDMTPAAANRTVITTLAEGSYAKGFTTQDIAQALL